MSEDNWSFKFARKKGDRALIYIDDFEKLRKKLIQDCEQFKFASHDYDVSKDIIKMINKRFGVEKNIQENKKDE